MTHRQRVGLLVIGVALALTAAAAGLRPHPVVGVAQATPVPGQPVVGECVLDPVPGPPMDTPVTATSGGTVPVYPAQQIQPCTGPRYGEITAVITTPQVAVVKGDNNNRYLDDPNRTSCILATARHVGVATQPIQRFWQTGLQINFAMSRPSPRQEAAAQRWAACIVTLQLLQPAQATATAPAPTAPRYSGSIRNALHTGQERDHLGNCILAIDWNSDSVAGGCKPPHALEILAYGESGDRPVTRVQVESTCQQAVRELTGIPDPTAAGALAIQINGAVTTSDGWRTRSIAALGI